MPATNRIRCRPIGLADLPGVAALLARGFPRRPLRYWTRGLDRLARRGVVDGLPRFGFLLEHDGAPVGAVLLIAQTITHAGEPFVRCNVASWYVDPEFRSHAAMLGMMPLRYKTATQLNISPAPNTWPTIEAQGFRRYTFGQRVGVPLLGPRAGGRRVVPFARRDHGRLPEADLLADHAAMGCITLVGEDAAGAAPFVFLPFRFGQGRFWFPGVQLVFCRDLADLERFARPLGRLLLRRGLPLIVHDSVAGQGGLPGVFVADRARKYVRGAREPRLGDLAYTEFTIFGP